MVTKHVASELEYDLRDTVDLCRKWKKLSLFCFTGLIILVLLMGKWTGFFLKGNPLSKCWDYYSLLNWSGVLTLSLLLKLPPRKVGPWFILLRLFYITINMPKSLLWNTGVMFGFVFLTSTWICKRLQK